MYIFKLKQWYNAISDKINGQFPQKQNAISPGGVEYNPSIFKESILLTLELQDKIESLEQHSEQFQSLVQLKKQIHSLGEDTDDSILQVSKILKQLVELLNQYTNDLNLLNQGLSKSRTRIQLNQANPPFFSLETRLDKVNLLKKQLTEWQSLLLSRHLNLSRKILHINQPLSENVSYSMQIQ